MRICPKCAQKGMEPFCGRDGTPTLRSVDYHPGKPNLVGKIVGDRYRLLSILGEGGMGCVWFGEHLRLRQPVAIKVIHEGNNSDAQQRSRFEREASTMSRVRHQNVVLIHDFGFEESVGPYLAMEYLEGIDLRRTLKTLGALSPKQIVHIAGQIAAALVAAHQMGLVHRDLKPANIFVVESSGTSNFIKVLDFGISKPLKEMFISEDEPESLTQTGIILGTPFYMAPEQASGITSRSADLYSLGVILHECLTGKRPFTGSSPLEIIMQHMNKEPPALSDKVPQDLQNLIFSLMAKQPTERPKDAKAVLDLLHDIGSGALTGESHDTVVDVSLNLANIETSELLQVNPHGSAGLSEITPALPQTVTEALDPFATTKAPANKTQNTRRRLRLQGLWIPAGLVLIAIATTSFTIHRIRDSRGLEDGMKVLPGAITKQIETVRRDAGSDPGAGQTQGPVSDPARPVIEAESTDPPPPAQPKIILHSFSILTLPPNAIVQIKPKKRGSLWSDPRPSPIEIKVPEGTYELRVRKSDYKTRRKTFLVKSDTRTTIKLQPDLGDL